MDRRLLFPAVAITAWAQQTNPAAAKAEKALRARVEQFYQLQVDHKYRQVEPMVADDTKDLYYNASKPDLKAFSIEKVEILDHNTRARVTVKTTQIVLIPGAGPTPFDLSNPTLWKKEKGHWVYYIDQDAARNTPFGRFEPGKGEPAGKLDKTGEAPDLATLMSEVTIDRTSIELTESQPSQTVTITNSLPGLVELKVDPHIEKIEGLTVELSKPRLNSGERSVIGFRASPGARFSDVVRITAYPLNKPFDIRVAAK
jgi:uncharacterized protein YchJ